jgi:hypothetical protein
MAPARWDRAAGGQPSEHSYVLMKCAAELLEQSFRFVKIRTGHNPGTQVAYAIF